MACSFVKSRRCDGFTACSKLSSAARIEKAAHAKGITGENLMSGLERRLDSVIYRMGFGTSRAQSRQIVRHGHIDVNGRKCNIPSAQVKVGDTVSVRESSRNHPTILSSRDATAHAPRRTGSMWTAKD